VTVLVRKYCTGTWSSTYDSSKIIVIARARVPPLNVQVAKSETIFKTIPQNKKTTKKKKPKTTTTKKNARR
jgi:hypothetical protein